MSLNPTFGQNLVEPPRDVPLPVRCRLLLGGAMPQFGFGIFAFGSVFMWVFGSMADLTSWYRFAGTLEETKGRVTRHEATNASVNDADVIETAFHYEVAGSPFDGVSYRTGGRLKINDEVTVEYDPDNPGVSRIKGMRQNLFPGWILLLISIFPLLGLGAVVATIVSRLKVVKLLAHGREALGRLKSTKPTGMVVNDQRVYLMKFEFDVDGKKYLTKIKTHKTRQLEDDELEAILYLPDDPKQAVTLDHLPGMPTIAADGSVVLGKHGFAFLIIPALAVIINLFGIFIVL